MWLMEVIFSFFLLFAAIDCLGASPYFLGLTENLRQERREETAVRAVWFSFLAALCVIILAVIVFWLSGIKETDVSLAGGAVLLIFSLFFLAESEKQKNSGEESAGIMPPATGLIIKAPVLTALIILAFSRGIIMAVLALILNLVIVFIIFRGAKNIVVFFGKNGIKIMSRLMDILLCVFSVYLVRKSLEELFKF